MLTRSLFPLPLTSIENQFFVDDRPTQRMTFFIEIVLSGDLQPDVFACAIREAVRRHPLLQSCVHTSWRGRHWRPTTADIDVCIVEPADSAPQRGRPIDLRSQPGLRAWILPNRSGGGVVDFEFHHAATDGAGAIRFIGDVLAIYARLTASDGQLVPELLPLDAQLLRLRESLVPVDDNQPSLSRRLKRVLKVLGCRPAAIAAPNLSHMADTSDDSIPVFESRTISGPVLRSLKSIALAQASHVNDLYAAVMCQTIYAWNKQHAPAVCQQPIRVLIPNSLRTAEHALCPAANIVSLLFPTVEPELVPDLYQLTARIHEMMVQAQQVEQGRLFCRALSLVRRVPGLTELCSRLPVRFGTAVLANVGDVRRQLGVDFPLDKGRCVAGSVILEELHGAPPLRAGVRAALSLGSYAGQLFLNLHCDRTVFDRVATRELLEQFAVRLESIAHSSVNYLERQSTARAA